jgi:hypothetical protein
MANPFPFVAGDILTAAELNGIGEALTSFTPVWTAATTNPVIGNGSLLGQVTQVNKIVYARFTLIPGSTTTYGTGEYRFDFPVAAKNLNNFGAIFSAGYLYDNNLNQMYSLTASMVSSGSVFRLNFFPNSTQNVTAFAPTSPITLATNDELYFTICYEAA